MLGSQLMTNIGPIGSGQTVLFVQQPGVMQQQPQQPQQQHIIITGPGFPSATQQLQQYQQQQQQQLALLQSQQVHAAIQALQQQQQIHAQQVSRERHVSEAVRDLAVSCHAAIAAAAATAGAHHPAPAGCQPLACTAPFPPPNACQFAPGDTHLSS